MKTNRINRVINILVTLQAGRHYSACDLAEIFHVSKRTIFRDLRQLHLAGIVCYYDKHKHRYILNPSFFLPPQNLQKTEALSLLLFALKPKSHISPLGEVAIRAATKVENTLPPAAKTFCNNALQRIHIKTPLPCNTDLLNKTFLKILQAILKNRIIKIRYHAPAAQKEITTHLNPCHLIYSHNLWHVFGRSSIHRRCRPFMLHCITKLDILSKCFIRDHTPDIDDCLGKAWSINPSRALYHVKLKFTAQAAHHLRFIKWHSTQNITSLPDGSVIADFRVDGLDEIFPWILSHGHNVEVLSPAVLREKFLATARKILEPPKKK